MQYLEYLLDVKERKRVLLNPTLGMRVKVFGMYDYSITSDSIEKALEKLEVG